MVANIKHFLNMIATEKGAAANTIAAYRRDLEQFCEFVGKDELEVQGADISNFIADLNYRGISAKTIARKLSAIREFYKFLFLDKKIKDNPAADVLSPRLDKPLPKFLTEDEIKKLFAAAENSENFSGYRAVAMLKLMYACGLRVSELVGMPENCINYEQKQIMIFGKGSKERIVPVAQAAIDEIKNYKIYRERYLNGNKSRWLFPSLHAAEGHITRDGFFKNIKSLAVKAGISPEKVSPHVLRHSFATHLLSRKVNLRSLQKMLGHEDIATTEIYTHIISDQLRDEVRRNHPLAKRKKLIK